MLLEKSLLLLPTRQARIDAVEGILSAAQDNGTFTYTELLLSDEALYTTAFEIMDGVQVDAQNTPHGGAREPWQSGPLRLVSLDTQEKVDADNDTMTAAGAHVSAKRSLQTIKYSKWYQPRIPGTNAKGPAVKKAVDMGMDAMVDDSLDGGRTARGLLLKYGWPNRNVKSRSGSVGHLVEWRWLEKVAKAAGNAPEDQEIRDLWDSLRARFDAPKKTKNAAPLAAGATP